MMKKNNGITLTALVVTIIVLTILAGVSISLFAGKGGIINHAENTANEMEEFQNSSQSFKDSFFNDFTSTKK